MTKNKKYAIKDLQGNIFQYIKIDHNKYKYVICRTYKIKLNFCTGFSVLGSKYDLSADGILEIKHGYAWDGASGPTFDTRNTMRASCVHDVLYQMMRESDIPTTFKDSADMELSLLMIEDGINSNKLWNKIRAGYYYWGVRIFGGIFCKPKAIGKPNQKKLR